MTANTAQSIWFLCNRPIFTARCTLVQSTVLRLHVVRLSVTLVDQDHIDWKSWKLIARTICLTPSLFVALPKGHLPTPRGTWRNLGETRGGVRKMAFWSTKAAISLKRVQIQEKLLWALYYGGPIGTHQRSFLRHYPDLLRTTLPQDWRSHPTQNSNRYYLRNG